MAKRILGMLALIVMCHSTLAQAAQAPLRLKPSNSWHVDYGDDRCRLARQFGEADDLVVVFFDRYGPEEYFRMTVAGKPMKTVMDNGQATVQFGPTEAEQHLLFLRGNVREYPALVFVSQARVAPPTVAEKRAIELKKENDDWTELAPVGPVREAAIKYLSIGKPLHRAVILETRSMRAPLAALDKCTDNLLIN